MFLNRFATIDLQRLIPADKFYLELDTLVDQPNAVTFRKEFHGLMLMIR